MSQQIYCLIFVQHKYFKTAKKNLQIQKIAGLKYQRKITVHANLLSGVPDLFDRNKILSGGDLSHYQVPHSIRGFFYFVWFVFIHHNFQFYFELCTYCNILDIYLS